ncbi:hypothetical protein RKE29_09460 [Streptomyces sp. B1866]|uniref:hypothetical protein n=1 Tax=Streptomyces sp. B1866 TaxID=3075431 RepID=UPI00288C986B|nr:hypothetical protein [Streptomyces sp. B1866]MDT3396868.1 hypothetical protein [Streptomyces sp. B1866]
MAAQDDGRAVQAEAEGGGSVGGLFARMLAPGHLDDLHARGSLGVIFADAMTLAAEPAVEQAVRRGMREVAGTLTELPTRGQRTGEVRADVAPDAAAWWLAAVPHGLAPLGAARSCPTANTSKGRSARRRCGC